MNQASFSRLRDVFVKVFQVQQGLFNFKQSFAASRNSKDNFLDSSFVSMATVQGFPSGGTGGTPHELYVT